VQRFAPTSALNVNAIGRLQALPCRPR